MKINKMKNYNWLFIFLIGGIFISYSQKENKNKEITVINSLNIDREFETIELTKKTLGLNNAAVLEQYNIREVGSNAIAITQCVDEDGDGISDVLLFQPKIKAKSTKKWELIRNNSAIAKEEQTICYSRFVPERTDDYAWENNKVAFRAYGPKAQKMVEDKIKGGTLTSGIDAWLKRVDYPIINKWYEKEIKGTGSYHKDTGEGLDNFQVGDSRGIGGVAVKVDSIYYVSKNFTSWKTITTGPIRTSFILTYADWDASGNRINEVKHISLDYGSFLSKFEISVSGSKTISTGITLHNNDGKVSFNKKEGWFNYWQPLDDSELGTGIVAPKNEIIGIEKYVTSKKELCNLYADLKVKNNRVVYYAGFGWKKEGTFLTNGAWEQYLAQFAEKINNPLQIKIK
jgi:hypothetical protein